MTLVPGTTKDIVGGGGNGTDPDHLLLFTLPCLDFLRKLLHFTHFLRGQTLGLLCLAGKFGYLPLQSQAILVERFSRRLRGWPGSRLGNVPPGGGKKRHGTDGVLPRGGHEMPDPDHQGNRAEHEQGKSEGHSAAKPEGKILFAGFGEDRSRLDQFSRFRITHGRDFGMGAGVG